MITLLTGVGAFLLGAGAVGMYLSLRHLRTLRALRDGNIPGLPTVDRFAVSVLPEDDINYRNFVLYLDRRPGNRWLIRDAFDQIVCADGSRADRWDVEDLKDHWLPLQKARQLAEDWAPVWQHNGMLAIEALARRGKRMAKD